jgi:GNAT superfamily N-acetyltransferase
MNLRQASTADLDALVPLFDAYRGFYGHPTAPGPARHFLRERLERGESVILLAFEGDAAVGFTQLYPSFSSGAMARILILNDLFVAPEARRHGVGAALLLAAAEYARTAGAVRLTLSTAVTNTVAQSVYQRLGWKRDTAFFVYHLDLSVPDHEST